MRKAATASTPTSATGISRTSAAPHPLPAPARAAGFSLLELLVVVAIIGIFLGVAVLSTDLVSFDQRLEQEARRLATRIRFTSEEALMQSRDFGIVFFEGGYEFRRFENGQEWVETGGAGMEGFRLEDDMGMRLSIQDREVPLEPYCELFPCGAQLASMDEEEQSELAPDPAVILFSSGEVIPFELEFFRESAILEPGFLLSVAFDGETEVTRGEL